jgi:hypothetical protein
MDCTALRTQIIALLQRAQRLSSRALQRQFALGLLLASRVVMGQCWRHKVFYRRATGGATEATSLEKAFEYHVLKPYTGCVRPRHPTRARS